MLLIAQLTVLTQSVSTWVHYQTKLHNKLPAEFPIPNIERNYTLTNSYGKYVCFIPKAMDPAKSRAADDVISDLHRITGMCDTFVQKPCDLFELCHFKRVQRSDLCNRTRPNSRETLGVYNYEPLVQNGREFVAEWSSNEQFGKESSVIVSYGCDPVLPHPGKITHVERISEDSYKLQFLGPRLCDIAELQPKNVTTINCFPKRKVDKFIEETEGVSSDL